MPYSLKMFDSKPGVIAVHSSGYASIVSHSHEFVEMVYIERRKVIDVAEAQQVSQQAITDRLCRIKKKLQKFLADTLV